MLHVQGGVVSFLRGLREKLNIEKKSIKDFIQKLFNKLMYRNKMASYRRGIRDFQSRSVQYKVLEPEKQLFGSKDHQRPRKTPFATPSQLGELRGVLNLGRAVWYKRSLVMTLTGTLDDHDSRVTSAF